MIQISLSETDRTGLQLQARREVGRVSERIHFVLLSNQGYSAPQIGNLFAYDEETVRTWLNRYQHQGLAGLYDQPRSGRPAKERLLKAIVEAQISQGPACFGYVAACWTVLLLAGHLTRRFGVAVSPATVRRAVKAIGYRWRRPRLAPARKIDPDKSQKLAKIQAVLQNVSDQVHILFEDESDMHLMPVLRAMWMRGRQRRIPTPGNNQKIHLFGALDIHTGLWHYLVRSTKRSSDFIDLLEQLLVVYPTGTIMMIVDSASIHTSKLTQKWLDQHPRVQVLYLPKYIAADLNPVEKVWWRLKEVIAANRCFKDLTEVTTLTHRFFKGFSAQEALRLVAAHSVADRLSKAYGSL
jgi:transposase